MTTDEERITTEDTEDTENTEGEGRIRNENQQCSFQSLDPASPEQDRFANRIFWEVLRFRDAEVLRFRDILLSLRGFFSETQHLGI